MTAPVTVTDEGAVRIVRLNRPEKKNALTLAMYEEMARALREADQSNDDPLQCDRRRAGRLLRGQRHHRFSQGLVRRASIRASAISCKRWRCRQKPLVAAVDGVAVGIGTTLLFHCDHVVASRTRHCRRPFSSSRSFRKLHRPCWRRCAWATRAPFRLLVMGRPLTAAEAKDAGIVNTVVDSADVDATALKAAQRSRRCRRRRLPSRAG